jgi:hypothetical protein
MNIGDESRSKVQAVGSTQILIVFGFRELPILCRSGRSTRVPDRNSYVRSFDRTVQAKLTKTSFAIDRKVRRAGRLQPLLQNPCPARSRRCCAPSNNRDFGRSSEDDNPTLLPVGFWINGSGMSKRPKTVPPLSKFSTSSRTGAVRRRVLFQRTVAARRSSTRLDQPAPQAQTRLLPGNYFPLGQLAAATDHYRRIGHSLEVPTLKRVIGRDPALTQRARTLIEAMHFVTSHGAAASVEDIATSALRRSPQEKPRSFAPRASSTCALGQESTSRDRVAADQRQVCRARSRWPAKPRQSAARLCA